MGIQGLKPHIKQVCEIVDIATFKDKTILVDASIYLRTYLHSGDGSLETILSRIGDQILRLTTNSITPIYVFDGSGYGKIKIVVAKRTQTRQTNQDKIDNLNSVIASAISANIPEITPENAEITPENAEIMPITVKLALEFSGENAEITPEFAPITTKSSPEFAPITTKLSPEITPENAQTIAMMQTKIQSLEVANRFLTREIIAECKKLLDSKGIKYIQATGEADTLISYIFAEKDDTLPRAVAVLSADSDMLTYGCPILITEISLQTATIYRLDAVLEYLKMTREMFVDFCILCGCDYSSKITGIAIKGANSYIIKHKKIETIITHINADTKLRARHPYPAEFITQYQIARNMFLLHSPDGVATKLY
jgi:5'-3' exonuclease